MNNRELLNKIAANKYKCEPKILPNSSCKGCPIEHQMKGKCDNHILKENVINQWFKDNPVVGMSEKLKTQIKNAEIVLSKQGGKKDTNSVSCNSISCKDCFGKVAGCKSTYADFKAFVAKHKSVSKIVKITNTELIEKMKGSVVNCESQEIAMEVNDLIFKILDIKLCNKLQCYKAETCYNINGGTGISFGSKDHFNGHGIKIISSSEFLSWFNKEEPVEDKKDQSITTGKSIDTVIERLHANFEYISERKDIADKLLTCVIDEKIVAEYKSSDNSIVVHDPFVSISTARVLGKWLVEMTEGVSDE